MQICETTTKENWNRKLMLNEYLNIIFLDVLKIMLLVVPVLIAVAMIVWLDRRVWGLVQLRRGPNVVGPFGLLQTALRVLENKNTYSETSMLIKKINPNASIRSVSTYKNNIIALGGDGGWSIRKPNSWRLRFMIKRLINTFPFICNLAIEVSYLIVGIGCKIMERNSIVKIGDLGMMVFPAKNF